MIVVIQVKFQEWTFCYLGMPSTTAFAGLQQHLGEQNDKQ